MPQANKRQKLMQSQSTATEDFKSDLDQGDDDARDESGSDASQEEEEEQGGFQQAAGGFTLDLGAAPRGDTKFRDGNFYLGYDRGDNRYAEEGFAVGGRSEDMVLDLAGDENVSLTGIASYAAACQAKPVGLWTLSHELLDKFSWCCLLRSLLTGFLLPLGKINQTSGEWGWVQAARSQVGGRVWQGWGQL